MAKKFKTVIQIKVIPFQNHCIYMYQLAFNNLVVPILKMFFKNLN